MRQKIAVCLLTVLLTALLAGCWDYREVESLASVAGIAVDMGEEPGQYNIMLDIVNLKSGGKDTSTESLLISSKGENMTEALKEAGRLIGLQLYWSPLRIIIISRQVAEAGITPVMDWIMLNSEPRPNIEIMIASDHTAAEILQSKPLSYNITSFEIDRILEKDIQFAASAYYNSVYQAYNDLSDPGQSLALPCVVLVSTGDEEMTPIVSGSALFHENRLVALLDDRQTLYLQLITNQLEGGYFNVAVKEGSATVGLQMLSNSTDVSVKMENGEPVFTIASHTKTLIRFVDSSFDLMEEKDLLLIQSRAEEMISRELRRLIDRMQTEYGEDCFGLGNALYRSNPRQWTQLEDSWAELFKTVRINVTCRVSVENRSLVKQLMEFSGKEGQ